MPYLAALIPYAVGAGEATVTAGTYLGAAAEVAGIAGTALSYNASMQQAQQTKLNAAAQAKAIGMEQQRQGMETDQAQIRKVQEQRRFTASQENSLAGSGFLPTTGSAIDILADTYTAQQRELHDIGYKNDTNQWQLGSQAQAGIGTANSEASAIKGQAGGTLLSNAGTLATNAYGAKK